MKTSQGKKSNNPFFLPEERTRVLKAASSVALAPAVIQAFHESNQTPDPETKKNLHALEHQPVTFVVTGQQIGLFTGPLLTLSKAVTALRLAAELEREQGIKTIPVFWMQTEDHDFWEIASTTFLLHGRKWGKIALPPPPKGQGDSVGKIILERSATEVLHRELTELSLSPERAERMLSAYSEGVTLAESFRSLLAGYLKGSGMLFFDPMSAPLREQKGRFLADAFARWEDIERALLVRDQELLQLGVERQVKLRSETPLVALSLHGKRGRLTKRQGEWMHPAGVLSEGRIQELFQNQPELWTSSALLRPLMQQSFFPAASLVLGPAERRYFEQLAPLYDLFSLSEPLVVDRHCFSVVPESIESRLQASGMTLEDIENPLEEYLERLERNVGGASLSGLRNLRGAIREAWRTSADCFRRSQLPLDAAITRTERSLERNMDRFERKFRRALQQKYADITEAHRKLNGILRPQGEPLERLVNIASFDVESLLQSMFKSVDPFSSHNVHRVRHVKE